MQTHILYHDQCPDGFAAAFAAWLVYGDAPMVRYTPVTYGQPLPPIENGDEVFILDFSYPRDVLIDLAHRTSLLKVLDHHATAQAALAGLPFATFDLTKSGAVLAWEHFFPGTPVPELFQYVQDRDLWEWDLRLSEEVNAGLWRCAQRDFKTWYQLLDHWEEHGKMSLVQFGMAVLSSDNIMVESLCQQVRWCHIGKHRVPAVNTPLLQSEVCHELLSRDNGTLFVACWSQEANGEARISLRSRKGEMDVSEIAKLYGGGGRPSAAGFRMKLNHFAQIVDRPIDLPAA